MEIFNRLKVLKTQGFLPLSSLSLSQFYGIEINDFAHEIAILSLWLTEHQMNVKFKEEFGHCKPSLPLKESGQITCANATRIDWKEVCPKEEGDETYILGNPPYLGARMQNAEQKQDVLAVLSDFGKVKKIDYIVCWFLKAATYIKDHNSEYAFVSTNSICQGEQPPLFWPFIFEMNLEIGFAHKSFKWINNAKGNAGVTCIIVGVKNYSKNDKLLFEDGLVQQVKNINAYLTTASNLFVTRRSSPFLELPKMDYGNMAIDGGHLLLSIDEKNELIENTPLAQKFIRQIFGAQEFIQGKSRWCLWIPDDLLEEALQIPVIAKRIDDTREFRSIANDLGTKKLALKPHQFREMKEASVQAIIIPTVSSERREYIPLGLLKPDDVIIAPNQAIYDAPSYLFGVLSSKMHMVWTKTVVGKLETRISDVATAFWTIF